ncbi:hypothetical protein H0X10_03900 [Candidatus Saccharibacteria bacterium]|nr:hypothetical protein [Candidatus Saccharibacteria bacterium]
MEQNQGLHTAGQNMSEELLHPRENEGFLLPESWQFDVGIESIVFKKAEEIDEWGNALSRYRVNMSDGTRLGMNVCEPKERATDIPIIETPAWFTNLHGFNEHSQRAFGAIGFPSILVGHVGEERDSYVREIGQFLFKPWKTVQEMRSISLARQAHNMLEILQYPNLGMELDKEYVFIHGNSRGAMVQFPFVFMARERGLDVTFAMPVAPCFAEGLGKETIQELRATPNKEVGNVARLAVRNLFDMAGTGASTVNLSPRSLAYEFAHTDSLLNGDAGRFAPHTPTDQDMLIVAYANDLAGQKEKWEALYEDHPGVYVRGVPGAHLSIADKRTKAYVMRTFDVIGQQLHDGAQPKDLDLSHIRRKLSIVQD